MNEYFDLIEDSDLDVEEYKAESWIWHCPECHAIFSSKAIYNRTIFPWFGYHPNDGNCQVLDEVTTSAIRDRANSCKCKSSIRRVRSVRLLKNLVITNVIQTKG